MEVNNQPEARIWLKEKIWKNSNLLQDLTYGKLKGDYLQHLFLLFLSRYVKYELAFKGGTALQKAYALNRFSIDLDFTLNDVNFDSQTLFKKIVSNLNSFGLKTETIKLKKKVSEIFILKIQGPLYDGTERSLSSLRIEISLREKIILGFAFRRGA